MVVGKITYLEFFVQKAPCYLRESELSSERVKLLDESSHHVYYLLCYMYVV